MWHSCSVEFVFNQDERSRILYSFLSSLTSYPKRSVDLTHMTSKFWIHLTFAIFHYHYNSKSAQVNQKYA